MISPEEQQWISRVLALDDHAAFAKLVQLHQPAVHGFLRRLLGHDASRADDLCQETFWKAYRHLGQFQGRGRLLSWLFGIAYQQFITERRRQQPPLEPLTEQDLADTDNSDKLLSTLTFDQLLLQLRPEERAVVELHYRHDCSHPEISAALALPLGTVKTLLRRARLKLQALYARKDSI